ncbi:4-carboxymuconolactone decarboxylase domain/alkylhydroperoxidase AhpD family core domain protein [plant metagenome]|uniref:4-carboxymuconolactone decarboxylase domain/alkylhydroperoxidase AhpD family core domain protein n=1 Tax=plant metagenome TaxID=1297885 RepID=A0A484TL48_9ZZZZ
MSHAIRNPYFKLAPKAFKHLLDLSTSIKDGSLDARLVDLVFLRASQINGCGYCIDMHWSDLVKLGVEVRHLNAVAGWREAPFFSDKERAALRWTEVVTQIPQRDASDEEFAALKAEFSDTEIAELSFAIATINAWNLLSVSLRNPIPEKG